VVRSVDDRDAWWRQGLLRACCGTGPETKRGQAGTGRALREIGQERGIQWLGGVASETAVGWMAAMAAVAGTVVETGGVLPPIGLGLEEEHWTAEAELWYWEQSGEGVEPLR
jgi:hypothetical protein